MAHKLPLFSHHLVAHSHPGTQTEVVCGTSYTLMVPTPTRSLRPITYVWTATTDGKSSNLRVYSANTTQLKELGTIPLPSCCARATVYIPAVTSSDQTCGWPGDPLRGDLVWVATDDCRILLYAATDPERGCELGRIVLPAGPVSMVHHMGQVWVGLLSGQLLVHRRSSSGAWDSSPAISHTLGNEPITGLVRPVHPLLTITLLDLSILC